MEILPKYVTFEQAKLLKEKGFNENKCEYWNCSHLTNPEPPVISMFKNEHINSVKAPEQGLVIDWLMVNYGIWVYSYNNGTSWIGSIQKTNGSTVRLFPANNSPKEAYSAAFDYVLKELI